MSPLPPTRRVRRDDDGIALVLVLLFVLVTGVLIAALLSQSFTTFTAARTANSAEQRLYAAGGGIDWGIQQLKAGALADLDADPEAVRLARACNDPSGPVALTGSLPGGVLPIGGHDVTVTCQTTAGNGLGADGWAVFITDPAGGIATSALPAAPRQIFGPVYNAGGWAIDPASPVQLLSGGAVGAPGCATDTPAGLLEDEGSAPWHCASADVATPPVPFDLAAALAGAVDRPRDGDRSGDCTAFQPGRYTQLPAFASNRDGEGRPVPAVNYLQPGVYVFDIGPGAAVLDDVTIVGGVPAPLATDGAPLREPTMFAVDLADCPVGPVADADAQGSGVVIVLRGTPALELTGATSLELHSYVDPARPGEGVSLVRAVDGEPVDHTIPALSTAQSAEAQLALHGNTYLPTRGIDVAAAGPAIFGGAVVAADLQLRTTSSQPEAVQAPPMVSIQTGFGGRSITVVATTAATPSERALTITATLNIQNSGARPLLVEGWSVSP